MSFTYSVTAWGFEASRASTSSALRSDLSGFLPASAATESPALVMSPKTARLVRVAMGVLFSSLGAALCKRGARGGAAGGRRRASARPAGAVTLGGGARRAFRGPAEPSGVGYSGSAPRARRGGVRGPRSTARWLLAFQPKEPYARPFRVRKAVSRDSGPAAAYSEVSGFGAAKLRLLRRQIASGCSNNGTARGPLGEFDSCRRTAARTPTHPQSPHASPFRSFNGCAKTKQYGFHRAQKVLIAAAYRTLRPAGGVLSVTDNPEDGQHENPGLSRRSRAYKANKPKKATKNATRPRGDDTA